MATNNTSPQHSDASQSGGDDPRYDVDQQANESGVPNPSTWRTGDEPPTHRQAAYLETLAHEAGEELPDHLTKAEASEKIDELREETGRE